MLKITWIEFFLRSIPEVFVMVWGIYVLSREALDIRKYIISSIILAITTFFVRWLPIYYGVHMIINMILFISIMIIIGIPIIKSIYSIFLIFFILSTGEFLGTIIWKILNINTSIEFKNPFIKCLYGLPSLIFLVLFIMIINYLFKMKEGRKNVIN